MRNVRCQLTDKFQPTSVINIHNPLLTTLSLPYKLEEGARGLVRFALYSTWKEQTTTTKGRDKRRRRCKGWTKDRDTPHSRGTLATMPPHCLHTVSTPPRRHHLHAPHDHQKSTDLRHSPHAFPLSTYLTLHIQYYSPPCCRIILSSHCRQAPPSITASIARLDSSTTHHTHSHTHSSNPTPSIRIQSSLPVTVAIVAHAASLSAPSALPIHSQSTFSSFSSFSSLLPRFPPVPFRVIRGSPSTRPLLSPLLSHALYLHK